MELNLPWVLVEAAQKRWTSEKMNLGHLINQEVDTQKWMVLNFSIFFAWDSILECVYWIGHLFILF